MKNLQRYKIKIQQIKKKAANKVLENAQLEKDIADMQSVIQESRKSLELTGNKLLSALLKHGGNVESTVSDSVACCIFSFRGA